MDHTGRKWFKEFKEKHVYGKNGKRKERGREEGGMMVFCLS